MITIDHWREFFPFNVVRPEQEKTINFILNSFLTDGKRYVICEMGTGCGKSVTGVTVARYLQALFEQRDPRVKQGGSYVLTTQKVLQEQYQRDFGPPKGHLKLIKSAGSYTCQLFDKDNFVSCAEIRRLLKSKARCSVIYQMCNESCVYQDARQAFFESPEGITNYAFFLSSSTYNHDMQRRELLVLDEAHNVENAISSFIKIGFSNVFYRTVLGVKTPPVNAGQKAVYDWLTLTCLPRLKSVIKSESKKIDKTEDSNEALAMSKKVEVLKRNLSKIEHFMNTYDPDVWVLDTSKTDKRGERVYEFKPIIVDSYCHPMLFSHCDRVLMMSATILDKDVYCESVGIDKNDVAFLRIPSPFLAKNRPIHYLPVGSMSKAMIDKTLPDMVQIIKMILDQHSNVKGIIHCTNYKVAEHLLQHIGPKRLLTHTSDDREDVIDFHVKSKEPTVLVSPSMMEGVDLADDASRFQILCKVPFPYLGDAAVQKRMIKNPNWYPYQAVKSVVQAFGRSIRNENDHAVSYILDRDWERFFRDSKSMFPTEFLQSIC